MTVTIALCYATRRIAGCILTMLKYVPLFLATKLRSVYPVLKSLVWFNLVDGLIRLMILLTLLYVLSRVKDINRIFQYHGAEHKVVFNFESRQPLTVSIPETMGGSSTCGNPPSQTVSTSNHSTSPI